jgi:membrane dipeptidase
MSKMRFVDLHCDTIVCEVMRDEEHKSLRSNPTGMLDLVRMKEAGSLLQCLALYIPPMKYIAESSGEADEWEFFNNAADCYDRQVSANADMIRPIGKYADIEKNIADGVMSSMMTIENGVPLDGKIERLDEMYRRGVRLITLTHNQENTLGFPNCLDPNGGLKPFGIEVVKRMNELGMIIDTAHLSDGGFWDVVKYSSKPFTASHSNARALCPVMRNLTDDMLRAVADKGGVVGLNFSSDFLVDNASYTYCADVVRHARYMADKAGIDIVALGSDFDGIGCDLEFGGVQGFPMLEEAFNTCFTADEVDKITHLNALRLIKETVG